MAQNPLQILRATDVFMNCPDCGDPVEPGAQFCPKCYARIEPPSLWQRFLALFQGSARPRRPLVQIKKTITIKTTDKNGAQHEYHSLDEVPPELRAEIEKIQSDALQQTFSSSSTTGPITKIVTEKTVSVYRVKDAAGNERVYHSLEELPPEIRAALEQARKQSPE
ncbi:MAG TPA: zinc ribbon domain-containing protein [Candidatus Limnocylindrales bacterium]|jgi:hypothetical protein|nr:zinc ribbon domain-containing protein [Candidatus Limnocylindrales bacterium]